MQDNIILAGDTKSLDFPVTLDANKKHIDGRSDGFSHIILLYHFHRVTESNLTVVPFLDTKPRGVFATRAPKRPNPIGLSIVRLIDRKNNILNIEDIDILDDTPLLDIKPYIPEFDNNNNSEIGWLKNIIQDAGKKKSDDRFK